MRRVSLAVVSSLLATTPLLALPSAAAAAAAPPGATALTVTTVPLAFALTVGPNDKPCTVLGDLYLPSTATPVRPAAAIMSTNGFGGSKDDAGERGPASVGRHYAARGYVALAYSGLGFGGSDCEIYLDQREWDGEAGDLLAQFLGGRTGLATRADTGEPYDIGGLVRTEPGLPFDPVVGMIGVSYGGAAQYATASFGRIDTIVPQITWNDLSYALAPNNTSLLRGASSPRSVTSGTPGVSKVGWTSLFFGLGAFQDATNNKPEDGLGEIVRGNVCPNFDPRACPAILDLVTDGTPEPSTLELARSASVASYLDQIDIPVLLSQGQADTLFNLQEAIATYEALKARGNDVKMVWQSWGHSTETPKPGELDLRLGAGQTYLGTLYARWFDHYLLGRGPKPSLATEYYRDWLDDGSGLSAIRRAYASAPSYPVVPRNQRLLLSGSGSLVPDGATVRSGSATFTSLVAAGLPTSYSEVPVLLQDNEPFDAAGTFAQFTSAPLEAPLDLAGVPRLTVSLEAPTFGLLGPATQLVLFAKLYDLAPDGSITLQHRLVAPQRIADLSRPVVLELPGVVQRIPAGHRVAVVLAASDSGHRGNTLPGPITVRTTSGSPGVLELPVIPAANAGTPPQNTPASPPGPEGRAAGDEAGPDAQDSGSAAGSSAGARSETGSLAATGAETTLSLAGLAALAGAGLLGAAARRRRA